LDFIKILSLIVDLTENIVVREAMDFRLHCQELLSCHKATSNNTVIEMLNHITSLSLMARDKERLSIEKPFGVATYKVSTRVGFDTGITECSQWNNQSSN